MRTRTEPVMLTAVVACYRDALAIPVMYERLTAVFRKIGVDYEIIFVNDCSPDNTREVLVGLAARDPKVIAIHHTRNFGSQSAFTSGMRISSGDAVVLLDGDLQDPPELIERFHEKWLEGHAVVYGVRIKRDTTRFLQLAYKAFYRLFRATSYVPIPLDAGDFSLIDRRAVDVLNALPENNRFMRGLRAWVGFRQTGVPYERPERMFGRSTNSMLRNLQWARQAIFSFSYAPLDLIVWIAVATMGASFAMMVIQLALRLLYPARAPRGFVTLILTMLFVGGIQMLCLSIIGSYLSHIYDEIKRRPPYIVESFSNYPPLRDGIKKDSPHGHG
ncbi:MAG: glycosyltransferase family 2 protein [Chlamydiota bacterium]